MGCIINTRNKELDARCESTEIHKTFNIKLFKKFDGRMSTLEKTKIMAEINLLLNYIF